MPANLTADYKEAEAKFRAAQSHEEKLAALEEMLATVPKHKGTEKIQAEIKSKLAKFKAMPRKKAGPHHVDPSHVKSEGAGQVVVLGVTNTGKSSIVAKLTGAEPKIAPYPYTTLTPQPGMMPFEDIQIQLVDLPAIGDDSPIAWVPQTARTASAALVVVDLGATDPRAQFEVVRVSLEARHVVLVPGAGMGGEMVPPRKPLQGIVAANRLDGSDAPDMLQLFREEMGPGWRIIGVSAETGQGLEEIRRALFDLLGIVRVYSKLRGKDPVKDPFVLDRGQTVMEFAFRIHKDLAEQFKFARVWDKTGRDGQRVARDYVLEDGDTIEITA